MNELVSYAGLVLGLGILGRMIFLELRVRKQNMLLVKNEVVAKDAQIKESFSKLSDAELNALLQERFYPRNRDQ